MKKFIASLLLAVISGFIAVAHAEEVDSYFSWDIKNYESYKQSSFAVYDIDISHSDVAEKYKLKDKRFVYDFNIAEIDATRNKLYDMINRGEYSNAAKFCEMITVYQKIIFNPNYFDESLAELAAKLYLETDELETAEQKIKFLTYYAQDNLTKIRALNLQSDLFNRLAKYSDALQATESATELLKIIPDEKLILINQSHRATAYCGLGEFQKSQEISEKILPQLQVTFGKSNIETLRQISTAAQNFLKTQRNKEALKLLLNKYKVISEEYGTNNVILLSKATLELANYFLETRNTEDAEECLKGVLVFANRYVDNEDYHEALQLYKALNEVAVKYLPDNNPIVLKSEFGLANINGLIGNIPRSVELCKKNLPHFKKIFGEQDDETLALMKILSDNCLLLGHYSDAEKITDERLKICKKNFGENDIRTLNCKIDAANIFYRMGNYAVADKLLVDVSSPQNQEVFKNDLNTMHNFLLSAFFGELIRGGNTFQFRDFIENGLKLEEKGIINLSDSLKFDVEVAKMFLNVGGNDISLSSGVALINIARILVSEYHPKILETMNLIAESYVRQGELKEAESCALETLRLSRLHFGKNNLCEWMTLNTLSKIRRAEGNFSEALKIDNQALQTAETVCGKKSLERLQSLDAIADDHAVAGNFKEAVKIRERALEEYEKILGCDAVVTQVLTHLAEDYMAEGNYDVAATICDKAINMQRVPVYVGDGVFEFNSVTNLVRIKATAQKLSGNDLNAYDNFKKLIKTYEGQRASMVKVESSDESKSKWFASLIPVYKDAAHVSSKVGDSDFSFYCTEFCKGRNLIEHYEDILVVGDYLLTERDKNILNAYEELLVSCKNVAEYAAEINDHPLSFNAETVRLELYADNYLFKHKLREKYSSNKVLKANPDKEFNSWNWETIIENFDVSKNQKAIPAGACLIEFMKTSDDSLLVTFLRNEGAVQSTNIHVDKDFFDNCRIYHVLNSYPDIEKMFEDEKFLWNVNGKYVITESIFRPTSDADSVTDNLKWLGIRQKLCAAISEKIIPTLEKYAGNSSHWIISADEELSVVPFETLNYRDKLLIESADISYVPSLAVLNLMEKRERKNSYLNRSKDLFAMGDAIYAVDDITTFRAGKQKFVDNLKNENEKIDFTSLRWYNIEGTAKEINKVSSFFDNKSIFRREQATEKNLRQLNKSGELSKYKYLLFATHGIFVPKNPQYSSIVLSQINNEEYDGYVTVGEWMSYDLRSNLIYLSACETGLGGYQAGEGIVGIPYALTVAGNKDTVMSLWKVDDEATAEFTAAVFEKLSQGKSELQALNETKREFLKQDNSAYKDPSVWAAFLLYGI